MIGIDLCWTLDSRENPIYNVAILTQAFSYNRTRRVSTAVIIYWPPKWGRISIDLWSSPPTYNTSSTFKEASAIAQDFSCRKIQAKPVLYWLRQFLTEIIGLSEIIQLSLFLWKSYISLLLFSLYIPFFHPSPASWKHMFKGATFQKTVHTEVKVVIANECRKMNAYLSVENWWNMELF